MRARQGVHVEPASRDEAHLRFDVAVDPMSLVSEAEASAAFTRRLAPEIIRAPFLIAGPVSLILGCRAVPSMWHPGPVVYPNLDRWLRPLIEALSGPDRLLVSGSLIRPISVTTAVGDRNLHGLSITVTYPSDRLLMRARPRSVSPTA